jgi:hypothetical protein
MFVFCFTGHLPAPPLPFVLGQFYQVLRPIWHLDNSDEFLKGLLKYPQKYLMKLMHDASKNVLRLNLYKIHTYSDMDPFA